MSNVLKESALMYAEMGFAVFPIIPRSKKPVTEHGFKNASKDTIQIEKWWSANPNYNIGIATGQMSGGLVVIDLDVDKEKGKDGYATLKTWEREHDNLPETWRSITGRGGYHLFYRDSETHKCAQNLYEDIDIRGDGGYIIAPPSIHPNGQLYEWEQGPNDCEVSEVNSLVRDFLIGPSSSYVDKGSGFHIVETIPEG